MSAILRMRCFGADYCDSWRSVGWPDHALGVVRTTLTEIHGVGVITAARIIGEVGDIRRFPSKHHFAADNGTAPIPVASGRTDRYRLNRGGNRRLNRAIDVNRSHPGRLVSRSQDMMEKKRAEGKTRAEALRCLIG